MTHLSENQELLEFMNKYPTVGMLSSLTAFVISPFEAMQYIALGLTIGIGILTLIEKSIKLFKKPPEKGDEV